jgi:hypothetical protein
MLLHDPSLSPTDAVSRLEDLALQGFVGVRFNPYLWPKLLEEEQEGSSPSWAPMSQANGAGLAVYKRCGELHMPVGVMCFQGLQLHYDDILALLKASPDTILILDHFVFTSVVNEIDDGDKDQDKDNTDAILKVVGTGILSQVREDFGPVSVGHTTVHESTRNSSTALESLWGGSTHVGSDFPFVPERRKLIVQCDW